MSDIKCFRDMRHRSFENKHTSDCLIIAQSITALPLLEKCVVYLLESNLNISFRPHSYHIEIRIMRGHVSS